MRILRDVGAVAVAGVGVRDSVHGLAAVVADTPTQTMKTCRWCGAEGCIEHADLDGLLSLYWQGRARKSRYGRQSYPHPDAVRGPDLPIPSQAVRLPAACFVTDESIQGKP